MDFETLLSEPILSPYLPPEFSLGDSGHGDEQMVSEWFWDPNQISENASIPDDGMLGSMLALPDQPTAPDNTVPQDLPIWSSMPNAPTVNAEHEPSTYLGYLCDASLNNDVDHGLFVATDAAPKRQKKIHRGFICPMNGCTEVFDRSCDLRKHHQRRHLPEAARPLGCLFCDRRFCDRKDLNRHVGSRHKNGTPLLPQPQQSLPRSTDQASVLAFKRRRLRSPRRDWSPNRVPLLLQSEQGLRRTTNHILNSPIERRRVGSPTRVPSPTPPVDSLRSSPIRALSPLCTRGQSCGPDVSDPASIRRIALGSTLQKSAKNVDVGLTRRFAALRLNELEQSCRSYREPERTALLQLSSACDPFEMVAVNGPILLLISRLLALRFSSDFCPDSAFKLRSLLVPKQRLKFKQAAERMQHADSGQIKVVLLTAHANSLSVYDLPTEHLTTFVAYLLQRLNVTDLIGDSHQLHRSKVSLGGPSLGLSVRFAIYERLSVHGIAIDSEGSGGTPVCSSLCTVGTVCSLDDPIFVHGIAISKTFEGYRPPLCTVCCLDYPISMTFPTRKYRDIFETILASAVLPYFKETERFVHHELEVVDHDGTIFISALLNMETTDLPHFTGRSEYDWKPVRMSSSLILVLVPFVEVSSPKVFPEVLYRIFSIMKLDITPI